jgi:hypothetical protein
MSAENRHFLPHRGWIPQGSQTKQLKPMCLPYVKQVGRVRACRGGLLGVGNHLLTNELV